MNRADLRQYILLIAGRMLKWSTISSAATKFGFYQGTLPPAQPGEPANTQPVRVFQDFGFRSALPPGTEIIVGAPRGGATNAVVLASDNMGHGPTDLAEGEVAVYNKVSGTVIKLDKDGTITITAGAGKDVIVNGGTRAVARLNDPVSASAAMVAWTAQVVAQCAANVPPITIPPAPAALGFINDGSATVKVP